MKVKIDEYTVYGKERAYEVLMFPSYPSMEVYEVCAAHPEENGWDVDGSREEIRALAIATAILAEDPSKIIYFPLKKDDFRAEYRNGYSLVLARPELQLRRSEWPRLKSKLDKKHWKGKYVFSYHAEKLSDYDNQLCHDWHQKDREKKNRKKRVEELIGDTVFWILPRESCYEYHHWIAWQLDGLEDDDFDSEMYWRGYILSDRLIQERVERIDSHLGEEPLLSESPIYKEPDGFRIDVCFCVAQLPYFKVYKGPWHHRYEFYTKRISMCRIQFFQPAYTEGIGSDWRLNHSEKQRLVQILKEENPWQKGLTNWQVLLKEYRYKAEAGKEMIGLASDLPMPDYMLLPE